ncbi:TPA_asm: RNA-directed RNA polymerase, partial [ssRNA phage Esthiorhiza.2_31]
MSKRYEEAYLRMVQGVFLDALTLDPTLHKSFERDLLRLKALIRQNGIPVFMIWLPAIDKALCRALDSNFLPSLQLPLTGKRNGKSRIPKLFQGIWMKIFDDSGCLMQDCDPTFVLLLRQLLSGFSKMRMEAPESALYRTTGDFFHVESNIPPPHPLWDGDGSNIDVIDPGSLLDLDPGVGDLYGDSSPTNISILLDTCQRLADVVASSFGVYSPGESAFRHGRGATSEFRRGEGYKYSFPAWSSRLEYVYPYNEFGTSNSSLLGDISQFEVTPPSSDGQSRLIPVPKTHKAPRLIAAEPAANQWCQQNLLNFFVDALSVDRQSKRPSIGLSIDFERQDLSGITALESSQHGQLATIDLKEASDRLSCWLIQRLWRSNYSILSALVACRTRYLYNDVDSKLPSHIKLRKFATMGSALTFPMQSLAFFVICIASGLVHRNTMNGVHRVSLRNWRELCRDVRIYGDDLIVPVEWMTGLRSLMTAVGLKINDDKTFEGSSFRESCGIDAFRGYDVTPVKVKCFADTSKPSTVISVIDTCNLLHVKGLWHTAQSLRSSVDLRNIGVHHVSDGYWGDVSFSGRKVSHLKMRWSPTVHRNEYLMLQPRAVSRSTRRFEGASNLLQYFTEDPTSSSLADWQSGKSAVSDAGICRRWVSYEVPSNHV